MRQPARTTLNCTREEKELRSCCPNNARLVCGMWARTALHCRRGTRSWTWRPRHLLDDFSPAWAYTWGAQLISETSWEKSLRHARTRANNRKATESRRALISTRLWSNFLIHEVIINLPLPVRSLTMSGHGFVHCWTKVLRGCIRE